MLNYNFKNICLLAWVGTALIYTGCQTPERSFSTYAPPEDYLGMPLPDSSAQIFAPDLISTAMYTRDLAMTADGNEIYFCVSVNGYNLIFFTQRKAAGWTEPRPAEFIQKFDHMYYEPHITADGKRLLFFSNMPAEGAGHPHEDIWAVDRMRDGWGEPYNLGAPVNTDGAEFYPSTTLDGTLYFTRKSKNKATNIIYRARFTDGTYQPPEALADMLQIGRDRFNAYIDPRERFLIIPAVGMPDSYGGCDYYISFRDSLDKWSEPVNMGPVFNTKSGHEYSCSLSPDGKYFFFMSGRTTPFDVQKGFPTFSTLKELSHGPGNGNPSILLGILLCRIKIESV